MSLKKLGKMDPYFHFQDPIVLSSFIQPNIFNHQCKLGHFDNVVIHDLLVLFRQVFQLVENIVYDEDTNDVDKYCKSTQMYLVNFLPKGDLDIVVHANCHQNELHAGYLAIENPIIALVRYHI